MEALANLLELQSKLATDRSREKIQTGRATTERFTPSAGQLANFSGMLAPGAGIADAAGQYPALPSYDQPVTKAFSQTAYPSLAENIETGRYLDAGLQSLGVAGDALYGLGPIGAAVGTPIKGIGALGLIARAKPKIVGAPSEKFLADELATTPVTKTEGKKSAAVKNLNRADALDVFSGIKSTKRDNLDDYFNPIIGVVEKRPELQKLSKEALAPREKNGIVSLYRVYNIADEDKLLPETGIRSLTTDLGTALDIGDQMKYMSTSPLGDNFRELIRPAQVARYDVPIDMVKAHVPTLVEKIPERIKNTKDNENYARAGIKEGEVLADLKNIEPAEIYNVPYKSRMGAEPIELDSTNLRFPPGTPQNRTMPVVHLKAMAAYDQGRKPFGLILDKLRDQKSAMVNRKGRGVPEYMKAYFNSEKKLKDIRPVVEGKQKLDNMYSQYTKLAGLTSEAPRGLESLGGLYLSRSVMPAPQKMFDPASSGFNPNLAKDFDFTEGGRYLLMGNKKADITGEIPAAAKISIGPDGKPNFKVSNEIMSELPKNVGKKIRTNLFKKKAGWKWTKTPKGFDPNPPSNFPLVSVETGNKHYYTLSTNFEDGVELATYPTGKSEPRLRPTTEGIIKLGDKVGEISVRGKKHPVYDKISTMVDPAKKKKKLKGKLLKTKN